MKKLISALFIGALSMHANAQNADSIMISKIFVEGLTHGQSYDYLREMCKKVGSRLSGSPKAAKAIELAKKKMEGTGLDKVYLEEVMVPHWVRGVKEEAGIYSSQNNLKLPVNICALGGSIATPEEGIKAKVIEVKSFEELRAMSKDMVKDKIVFFNRPMDPSKTNPFEAYGGAVNQRGRGAVEAAKMGAVAAIVRSMTTEIDRYPHTGAMHYEDSVTKVPTAAISTVDAELLSRKLKNDPELKFYFRQSCKTLPDTLSHNVVGQLNGTQFKDKVIVVGGHHDSWDLAEGAHDDGAGVVQSLEALRILKALGYKPKHTLRCVFFINEENGLKGGVKYAELSREKKETHIAAIESDAGGFTPRGFTMASSTDAQIKKAQRWKPLLLPYGLYILEKGHGGADISPLMKDNVPCIGLVPDPQRYFTVHHAATDVFESVNKRELEMGAAAMAALIYLIDQYEL